MPDCGRDVCSVGEPQRDACDAGARVPLTAVSRRRGWVHHLGLGTGSVALPAPGLTNIRGGYRVAWLNSTWCASVTHSVGFDPR